MTPSPSLTATPADSCPRCCSANNPSAAIPAASWPGAWMPTMPHTLALLPQRAGEAALPRVSQLCQRAVERVGHIRAAILRRARRAFTDEVDIEAVAADGPDATERQ